MGVNFRHILKAVRNAAKYARALGVAASAVAFALACSLSPAAASTAFATYRNVDTQAPAFQDLGSYGAEIPASVIPDGVYEVEARTDSSMCVFYRNIDDVNARANKDRCYIQVRNGAMTAVFYTSRMYTRLYFGGDGHQAAALTNADGTDDSAYLAGDPPDGYVPHLYAMAIPALNYPMQFASFAGGDYPMSSDPKSTWYTRAKWYSHFVVFKPTADLQKIIDQAASGAPDQGESVQSGTTPGAGAPSGAIPQGPAATGAPADDPDSPQTENETSSGTRQGTSGASSGGTSGSSAGGSSSAASGASASATAARGGKGGKGGVSIISPAQFKLDGTGSGAPGDIPRAEAPADADSAPVIVCGIAAALLAAAGIGWRVGSFKLSKTKAKEGTQDVG